MPTVLGLFLLFASALGIVLAGLAWAILDAAGRSMDEWND